MDGRDRTARPGTPHVEALQLRQGEGADQRSRRLDPTPVRRPRDIGIERGVVRNHRNPIRRHADIEFDPVHADRDRLGEPFQRVLRIETAGAAMSEQQNRHGVPRATGAAC